MRIKPMLSNLSAWLGLTCFTACCAAKALNFADIARNRSAIEENPANQAEPTLTASAGADFASNAFQFSDNISEILATSVLAFAHNVGKELGHRAEYSGSEVFSPISIMSALAMLMLGAKGRSYLELQSIFGLDHNVHELFTQAKRSFHTDFGHLLEDLQSSKNSKRDEQIIYNVTTTNIRNYEINGGGKSAEQIIKVANGLFTQNGYHLNPDYLYASRNIYRSSVIPLDFAAKSIEARNYINQWVERSTFGKIPLIIGDDIARGTNVILASALYFKGFWETPFLKTATVSDNFYPDGLQQPPIEVQMMATGGEFPFYNSPEYDCRIIGLPYKGNLTTMYIIQPNHSTRSKLRELQNALDATKIDKLLSRMTKKTATLALPKMHFVHSIDLKNILNTFGVRDIFINGLSDLSLIGGVAGHRPFDNDTEIQSPPIGSSTQPSPTTQPFQAPLYTPTLPPSPHALAEVSSLPQGSSSSSPPANETRRSSLKLVVPEDRFNEPALIFQRFGSIDDDNINITDQILSTNVFDNLERDRFNTIRGKSDLFVQDIVHKVDIEVNEQGTEAAAATLTYIRRSGTDVSFRADTPFLFLIRHDLTKLILFYGIVNEP